MISKDAQALLQYACYLFHMADDVRLIIDLEGLQRDGGTDRMAGISEAMTKNTDFVALRQAGLPDWLRDHQRGNRQISGGQSFRERDHIGLEVVDLATEHGA